MSKIRTTKSWLDSFNTDYPFIVAGPCGAETENQVMSVAKKLKDTKVSVFRAGIWKPRTRPGNFEGVGEIGLEWLSNVKKETGLKVATEVATPKHVELALKYDVDVLWIGARTTVSPFNVQQLAEVLQGTSKIVLIKNPVNCDLALWLGAVERFQVKDVSNIGVIHRGFSSYQKTIYRNNPQWQIPIDLKAQFPDMPIICDPSHIAGDRDLIRPVSQTALDLNFEGLMIETHCDPDKAWSDAKQQVTPDVLLGILENLTLRKSFDFDAEFTSKLHQLRTQIDVVDDQIITILDNRMKISSQIGKLKKKHNVVIFQNERWNELLEKMRKIAKENSMSQEFIASLYKVIHQESIVHQKK